MLKVKDGVTQGGPAAAAVGARPGWALPFLLGGISSLYPLPCTFFLLPPYNQSSGVSPRQAGISVSFLPAPTAITAGFFPPCLGPELPVAVLEWNVWSQD